MQAYDAGHRETQTLLPDPLGPTGLWNVGTFALPATLLSVSSAIVLVVVWAVLQYTGGRERELFVLPSPYSFLIGAIAAVLAWAIALRCRHRPGRTFPRIWALALAALSSVFALLGLIFPEEPWSLALAIAGLAAAVALSPRFVRLHPDSPMLPRIAPLAALMVLLLTLPSSCAVRKAIVAGTEQRVDQRIQQLRLWTTEVQEVAGYDWRGLLERNPESSEEQIERLKTLRFGGAVGDGELWRSAATLGKDDELAGAAAGLVSAVVAGFNPERVPRISTLSEPAIHWDPVTKQWKEYSSFDRLSGITGSYHEQMGRLFTELAPDEVTAEGARLVDLRQHYAAQRAGLQGQLHQMARNWADNWAIFKIADREELIGFEEAPLAEVLKAPFARSGGEELAPADLWNLSLLPLSKVQSLDQGAVAPGCQGRPYEVGDREYFRLDCYSYAPQKDGPGAELRVEMRLVYQSGSSKPLYRSALPVEVYFLFPIPEGTGSDDFREKVMTEFFRAVRELSPGIVRSTDRGGSVSGGFRIQGGDDTSVRVYRPNVVPLLRERRALEVRAERWPRPAGGL